MSDTSKPALATNPATVQAKHRLSAPMRLVLMNLAEGRSANRGRDMRYSCGRVDTVLAALASRGLVRQFRGWQITDAGRALVALWKPRVRGSYAVEFTVTIEQDETGDDKPFDAENALRFALEKALKNGGRISGDGGIEVIDLGTVAAGPVESDDGG